MTTTDPPTARDLLPLVRTPTDVLDVDERGVLTVDGAAADALLDTYGSPLSVLSERTLQDNVRRFRAAFEQHWPSAVQVLYAMKANNALAVRAVLAREGTGADCFGAGEIEATMRAGADPAYVVLNGSNKTVEDIRAAVRVGAGVNVDAPDELELIEQVAAELSPGVPVRVKLRLKVLPADLTPFVSDSTGRAGAELEDYLRRKKWGFSVDPAAELVRRLLSSEAVRLTGYHLHVPRVTRDPRFTAAWAGELGRTVVELWRRTGYAPQVVDVGGGWPRERDPEGRDLALNRTTIEEYAAGVCAGLRAPFDEASLPVPELWLEPGRYLVGNAGVLLGRVGSVKRDVGLVWVNTDISTNLLTRIDANGCVHHVLPASGMDRPCAQEVQVVGPTCVDSLLGRDRRLPDLVRGDLLAVLDAGMYADSTANQFNALPRPAVVMVPTEGPVELVRRRELVEEIFARDVVPGRWAAPQRRAPEERVGEVLL